VSRAPARRLLSGQGMEYGHAVLAVLFGIAGLALLKAR
jgi:hypothetical protein